MKDGSNKATFATTTLTYDLAGRKTGMTGPDMGTWAYTYTALGSLTNQTDARSCTTSLSYDLLNRPTGKSYSGSGCGATTSPVTYLYDGLQRIDTFDGTTLPEGWSTVGGTVSGGQVTIPTGGGSWINYIKRSAQIEDGQGVEVTFTPNSNGIIYLGNGKAMYSSPGTADLRRWGLYWTGGTFYRDYAYGTNSPNDLSLGVSVQMTATYTVRLEVDGTGNYQLKLWKTNAPSNILASRSELPPGGSWSGQQYSAIIFAINGNLTVQEYREILSKNGLGQRTGMLDSSGGTAWSFDNRGRLTSETKTITGSGLFRTQYGYNTANMQAWMKYPADNAANTGEKVTYGYNTQGAFDTLKSSISSYYYVPITLYDAAGRLVERQYGSPNLASNPLLKSVSTYNGWGTDGGRLQRATAGLLASSASLQDLRYTYDDTGNILTIQDYKAGNPQTQTFTYDNLNRLISAVATTGTGNYGNYSQETTSYDTTTGNIASKTGMGNYTYTDSAHAHAVTKLNGTQKYWYDANGNMTTRIYTDTYTLSYNAENQMTAISGGGVNTGYVYDGNGARVKSTNIYQNLAAGASVTSTLALTYPDVITNGDNWADNENTTSREYAYTTTGLQYVQVDLGAVYIMDKVTVWHYNNGGRTYHNTKTQVSADGKTWTTIFNSAVSGEYAETAGGKTTNFTAQNVRYIRDYLNGSTANTSNQWVEIAAWGKANVTYIGNHFEWTGSVKTMASYYYAGGQRVAMRRGSALNYLLGDHLSSNSLSVDNVTGSRLTELRYKAWGEDRTAQNPGRMPTSFAYTGQRRDSYINLYWYSSRWYDPALGRFIQPDSIIPEAVQGVQAWDRYAGMNNNPVRWNDPSGHCLVLCTALIGAGIGAIVGALTYTFANQSNFNTSEMLIAAGGGAIAGALIGSGVGVVAGATTAAAAASASGMSTALISSGVSATVASESYMMQSAGNFNAKSYVVNTGAAAADGYFTSSLSFFPAKAGLKMALGGVTYLATAEKPSATGFGASMAAGVGGAFLDSSLGVIGKSLDDTSFMPRSFANSAADRLQDAAVTQRLQNTSLALFGGFISSLGTDATSYWAQKIALEVK